MVEVLERPKVSDALETRPTIPTQPPHLEPIQPPVRRPFRRMRWLLGGLVAVIIAIGLFVFLADGSTVVDDDGSFLSVETARFEALAPAAVVDVDGSFLSVETARFEALAPFNYLTYPPQASVDGDGSFLSAETARFEALAPAVIDADGSFLSAETARFMRLEP